MRNVWYVRLAVVVFLIFITASFAWGSSKPDIIQYNATYHDDMLSINIQWQSPNPVITVKVYAGKEPQELEIDEYDNRRNPRGYHGETTVVVNLEPGIERKSIKYVIQLIDDVGQRSKQVRGEVKLAAAASTDLQPVDQVPVEAPIEDTTSTEPTDIVEKLIAVAERHDAAPSVNKIKINKIGNNKVNFSSKASDDKGLSEVSFRVFDKNGSKVKEQVFSDLGTTWQGTTDTFSIAAGRYTIVLQATDSSGNTSRERRQKFTIKGSATVTDESDTEASDSSEEGETESSDESTEESTEDDYTDDEGEEESYDE